MPKIHVLEKQVAELIAAGRGRIKLMTFAPEIAHADQLI